jgi:hypothetical protein
MENKTCLKPPTRYIIMANHRYPAKKILAGERRYSHTKGLKDETTLPRLT